MTISSYEAYDAMDLAALVRRGEATPLELLEEAIDRIEARNGAINAVVTTLYESARTAAAGPLTGAFAGVPFLIKDLAVEAKGAPVAQGSRLMHGAIGQADSTLIARYRAAGLVFAGITNSAEFGLSCETAPSLFGATRNPWDPARSAGGSSGGAAAAIAAGIVPAAHANDGGGSIRIPASCCGLFGLKTSRGRTPVGPHAGEAWNGLAVQNVISRSVRDTAALLDVSHGPEAGDPYMVMAPEAGFLAALGAPSPRLRIAVQTLTHFGEAVDPAVARTVGEAARLLEDLGHDVTEARPDFDAERLKRAMFAIAGCNVLALLEGIERSSGIKPSRDLLEPSTWAWMERCAGLHGADLVEAIHVVQTTGRQLGSFFERYDILLTPTIPTLPPLLDSIDVREDDIDVYYDKLWANNVFTTLYNCTGVPAASVPMGQQRDLPIGVQLAAPLGHDARILQIASELEQAAPWRDRRPATRAAV